MSYLRSWDINARKHDSILLLMIFLTSILLLTILGNGHNFIRFVTGQKRKISCWTGKIGRNVENRTVVEIIHVSTSLLSFNILFTGTDSYRGSFWAAEMFKRRSDFGRRSPQASCFWPQQTRREKGLYCS